MVTPPGHLKVNCSKYGPGNCSTRAECPSTVSFNFAADTAHYLDICKYSDLDRGFVDITDYMKLILFSSYIDMIR